MNAIGTNSRQGPSETELHCCLERDGLSQNGYGTELHCCLERDGCGEQPSVALTLNTDEQARTLLK